MPLLLLLLLILLLVEVDVDVPLIEGNCVDDDMLLELKAARAAAAAEVLFDDAFFECRDGFPSLRHFGEGTVAVGCTGGSSPSSLAAAEERPTKDDNQDVIDIGYYPNGEDSRRAVEAAAAAQGIYYTIPTSCCST